LTKLCRSGGRVKTAEPTGNSTAAGGCSAGTARWPRSTRPSTDGIPHQITIFLTGAAVLALAAGSGI